MKIVSIASLFVVAGSLLAQAVIAAETVTPAASAPTAAPVSSMERWSAEKAWDWYKKQPWLVGFNFLPSTAVNDVEMWQAETFDPVTMDRELGWAKALGFNTTRVFIQYIVWKQDPEGFKKRFEKLLELADKHGISVMPTLFDDCSFGTPRQFDPFLGKQREPLPGLHNPSWVPSPGRKLGNDPAERPMLKKYVQDMLSTYGKDQRVIVWDLYNEPMNGTGVGKPALLEEVFVWARAVNPGQPLTIGQWKDNAGVNEVACLRSDVISFHSYSGYAGMQKKIEELKKHGRPLFCTEWMGRRAHGSKWNTDLPLFKQQGVACYCWGLVNGRTQTNFAWSSKAGEPEPKVWFHDLFRKDGTPFDPAETDVIRKTTADKTLDWSKIDSKTK